MGVCDSDTDSMVYCVYLRGSRLRLKSFAELIFNQKNPP